MPTTCHDCKLGYGNAAPLDPKGTDHPDYYIVGYGSSEYEVNNNNPFDPNSSKANSYLYGVLNSLGINEMNCRFNKLIRCISDNRRITDDHRNACYNHVVNDIIYTNPRIIVGLGTDVAQMFLGSRFRYISTSRGRLYDIELLGKTFKFLMTYSPVFLTKDTLDEKPQDMTEYANLFYNDLAYCVKFVSGELVDISKKDLRYAKTYQEYKDYYDEFLVNAEMPSYDIESNAKDPRCSDFRIVGFSMAPDGTTGIYIIRNSLEYTMPEDDWDKCVELATQYLSSHKCLVHNIMYEKPATLNEWGFNITEFEDSLIKARLLLGGKTGAGLKEQCILNLGYPEWDADLGAYQQYFGVLWSNLYPTSAGKDRWDFEILRDFGINELKGRYQIALDKEKFILESNPDYPKVPLTKEVEKELKSVTLSQKERDNYQAICNLESLISEYYDPNEIDYIMNLIGMEVVNLIQIRYDGILPYSSVPLKIITKYGAMDSVGTQDLNDYLSKRMDNESTDNVHLWNGYEIAKQHFIVGSHLEMNGLYWNDEVASKNYEWLSTTAKQSLVNLLMSGFLDDLIIDRSMEILQDHVMNNMMDYVEEVLGPFEMQKSGIKLLNGNRRISYKNLIWELPESFRNQMRPFILEKAKSSIQDESVHPTYESLKYLFNPGSNIDTKVLDKILVNQDVQIGYIVSKLSEMLEDENFSINTIPMPDRQLFLAIRNIKAYNKEVSDYNKSDECVEKKPIIPQSGIFNKVKAALSQISITNHGIVYQIIKDAVQYHLQGASEPAIIQLYAFYKAMGVDIEADESTWTPEFKFLYDFRMYKKCIKLISSYINGSKVGRGSVWSVKKKDIEDNKLLPVRQSTYHWDGRSNPDEVYLMQPSWGVMTAETMRWRGGVHTIPMGRTVKGMYTSRYKGGVIAAPDYSQLEVRIAAGVSGCKALLDAFRNGEDVHLRTAMGIFNKPADQITKVERRFSKMGTFRILYGSTAEGFAQQFLDGNVEMARKIFDGFYSTYPEIKQWMDARHKEVELTGKVSCDKVGYFIYIDRNGPEGIEGAYRKAGNYPIQSQGSMCAGYVLAQINQFCMDRNMFTRPICFIHDSLEFDIHPQELFTISPVIMKMMNDIPINKFGIPTKADLTIGTSMGMENDCKSMEFSEDGNEGIFVLEGFEDDLDEMYEYWKNEAGYASVEYEDIGEKEEVYTRKEELFQEKLALGPFLGKTRYLIQRRFIIRMR